MEECLQKEQERWRGKKGVEEKKGKRSEKSKQASVFSDVMWRDESTDKVYTEERKKMCMDIFRLF